MKTQVRRKRYAAARGFSLLEISLVVVLIGLLTAGAAVALLGKSESMKVRITKTTMANLKGQIDQYMITGDGSPPTSLAYLLEKKMIEKGNMVDAWKQNLYYSPQGTNGNPYTLMSYGPDRQPGTADDIDYWTMDLTTDE